MPNSHYEIYEYSIKKLEILLNDKSEASPQTISEKTHLQYFENYFDDLGTKTIIAENNYIDRDYLEDFSSYYVRCFKKYKRKCTRLHFFKIPFGTDNFDRLLKGEESIISEEELQNAYLGFVVVKPLPQTIIGRSCLKTYGTDKERRHFPIIRNYPINLFGINLSIETLAYQEQDSVVSACATSALWSVFHGSGMLFQHQIPSPVDITKAACEKSPLETRFFPNYGLTPVQMALSIRNVGLEPFSIKGSNEEILKSTLYSYLKCGLPVLMGVVLVDVSEIKNPNDPGILLGKHAVAVTGFSLGATNPIPYKYSGFLTKASRIDRIYAHDDQIGPFARMGLDQYEVNYIYRGNAFKRKSLDTTWIGKNGIVGSVRAVPDLLLIPLYHKIRIPFEKIQDILIQFDAFLESVRNAVLSSIIGERIEWDIHLTTNNSFKTDLFKKGPVLNSELRLKTLLRSKPRFLWQATGNIKDRTVIDLLFDATDIEQGLFLNDVLVYEKEIEEALVQILQNPSMVLMLQKRPEWKILQWFSPTTI